MHNPQVYISIIRTITGVAIFCYNRLKWLNSMVGYVGHWAIQLSQGLTGRHFVSFLP